MLARRCSVSAMLSGINSVKDVKFKSFPAEILEEYVNSGKIDFEGAKVNLL